jgi:hypothetical protein
MIPSSAWKVKSRLNVAPPFSAWPNGQRVNTPKALGELYTSARRVFGKSRLKSGTFLQKNMESRGLRTAPRFTTIDQIAHFHLGASAPREEPMMAR